MDTHHQDFFYTHFAFPTNNIPSLVTNDYVTTVATLTY